MQFLFFLASNMKQKAHLDSLAWQPYVIFILGNSLLLFWEINVWNEWVNSKSNSNLKKQLVWRNNSLSTCLNWPTVEL